MSLFFTMLFLGKVMVHKPFSYAPCIRTSQPSDFIQIQNIRHKYNRGSFVKSPHTHLLLLFSAFSFYSLFRLTRDSRGLPPTNISRGLSTTNISRGLPPTYVSRGLPPTYISRGLPPTYISG